ncbi:MAG: putative sulfate exporter family transporter [Rhizobium sp.]|nr:putative sulfate exporter family transporter [Rhizobium sp.]
MAFPQATRLLPGLSLCLVVAASAYAAGHVLHGAFGAASLEPLVLAIVIGIGVRSALGTRPAQEPGIEFGARTLLEVAIVLLGATVDFGAIGGAGVAVIAVVFAIVIGSIFTGVVIGRLLGLSSRLSLLIACGNSICGNSAIVAVAPVIDARREEVAAALAFTAVLGIAIVVGLPLAQAHLGLSIPQYGAMAGLTVYAVPQVLAAAAPGGLVAMQAGTLVKLLRVLMLGPVILVLGILERRRGGAAASRPAVLMPWFIVGFIVLATLRSVGLVPQSLLGVPPMLASGLTVVAMAGLGLSVDIRTVAAAGGRVIVAASLSLAVLLGVSYIAILALPAHAFG